MSKFVVIKDMSASNDGVGEMWQETRIFNEDTTLKEIMDWALADYFGDYSQKRITITKPHPDEN